MIGIILLFLCAAIAVATLMYGESLKDDIVGKCWCVILAIFCTVIAICLFSNAVKESYYDDYRYYNKHKNTYYYDY